MILNVPSPRAKVLPIGFISLFLIFCYFYLLDQKAPDIRIWRSSKPSIDVSDGVEEATELSTLVGQTSLMSSDTKAAKKTSDESKQEAGSTSSFSSPSPTTTSPASASSTEIADPTPASSSTLSTTSPSDTTSISKKLDHGKVVMVTASAGTHGFLGIPNLKEMVYENRASYAQRHGYELMWADMGSYNLSHGEPIYWNKIPILQEAFARYPEAEWVWWLDIDIIIMEHSLSMWDNVLSPEGMARNAALDVPLHAIGGGWAGANTPATYNYSDVNFLISFDDWGMNTGNFLMRRSQWSDWLFDLWIEPLYLAKNWIFPDQDAWVHMFLHHPIVRKHTVCMKQRALNAYPSYSTFGERWQPGDHVVHFAGCGDNEECPDRWNTYWMQREEYEVPALIKQKLEDGTAEIENVKKGVGL